MNKITTFLMSLCILIFFAGMDSQAQGFLKKAAQKLQNEAGKIIDDEEESVSEPTQNYEAEKSASNSSAEKNVKRKMTPPDVKKNINSAREAYKSKNYDNTRFAVQQALMGIELEIGYRVLNSLPHQVNGIGFDEANDRIQSTGIGFAGLHIERNYLNDDKGLDIRIMNNAGMIGAMSSAMTNSMYSDENQKAVMVGGYKGLLELTEGGYYTLGISVGQSTLISMDFNNFPDENQVLAAAEEIDIKKIKELLGEQ